MILHEMTCIYMIIALTKNSLHNFSEQGGAHLCTLCTLGKSEEQCARCAQVFSPVSGTGFTLSVACIQSKDTGLQGYE